MRVFIVSNIRNYLDITAAPVAAIEGNGSMTTERMVRIIAGIFILASLGLAQLVSPKFLYFTVFVGLNLLQSGFSKFCPLEIILRKLGVPETADSTPRSS